LGGESHKNGTLSRNLQFWRSKNMEKGWKRSLQPSSGLIPRRIWQAWKNKGIQRHYSNIMWVKQK
jgi:mannosyltransferase OCH1-like enzyme